MLIIKKYLIYIFYNLKIINILNLTIYKIFSHEVELISQLLITKLKFKLNLF